MSKAVITCMETGCQNKIYYDPKLDDEVPLYCERHRTYSGRHADVRNLRKPVQPEPESPHVIMLCPSMKCHKRKEILKEQWMKGEPVHCECGRKMMYHKTVGE
jgi:hypothetical protein